MRKLFDAYESFRTALLVITLYIIGYLPHFKPHFKHKHYFDDRLLHCMWLLSVTVGIVKRSLLEHIANKKTSLHLVNCLGVVMLAPCALDSKLIVFRKYKNVN